MFGDIAAWMVKAIGGINPDPKSPGFEHFFVFPYAPADMSWAEATHECAHGTIRSAWRRHDDQFTLEVSVPPNTTATINVPMADNQTVVENDEPLDNAPGVIETTRKPGYVQALAGSGTYSFAVVG